MASEIRVNSLTNRSGLSTVSITDTGAVVAGMVTATTFSGPLTGNVTGNVTGNLTGNVTGNVTGNLTGNVTGTATTATALSGSPSITVTDITATGNVSIGGTLTYEDVTNIDSVGIVTAQSDVHVGAGLSVVGITTTQSDVIVGRNLSVTSGISTVKSLDYAAIDTTISDTAVDVFIYDTSKDSDGGAWRKRTTHTSWYNETLGTATRGTRREFPAVAVIVAQETNNQQVVIYDGDDPDLPMWMIFERGGNNDPFLDGSTPGASFLGNYPPTSVSAFNGIICAGCWRSAGALSNLNAGLRKFSFIEDNCVAFNNSNTYKIGDVIANRNVITMNQVALGGAIVNVNVRDVAMTVLPNAPIDDATGLPIPTIAVGTDGGVSIIKDDGSVVDITITTGSNNDGDRVDFTDDNRVVVQWGGDSAGEITIDEIPSADISQNYPINLPGSHYNDNSPESYSPIFLTEGPSLSNRHPTAIQQFRAVGTTAALSLFDENKTSEEDGMVAFISSSYNTGYQQGRIKGAFLSDTDTTNIVASEMVTNGTFDSNTTGWSVLNTGTFTASGGQATLSDSDGTGTSPVAYQAISGFVVGRTYVLSYDTTAAREAYAYISQTAGQNNQNMYVLGYTGSRTGTQTVTFVANSTNMVVNFSDGSGSDFNITVDNVSVKLGDKDRSVNNKGLQVFGTVPKQVVATGADLVSYGGFNNNNYLRQPYNSDLRFEQNDFSIMFWIYDTGVNEHTTIISKDEREFDISRLAAANGNKLRIYTRNSSEDLRAPDSTSALPFNKWVCVCVTYTGGNIKKVYIDGVLDRTISGTDGEYDIDSTSYGLNIGVRNTGGTNAYSATGIKLALMRISGSAPSSEQIKKIYEDEKVLFQENAACTLYGSSDAVTALAYDDDTDLLHVGTSSGRSDFQGLRRINNTTTAVTTAITAQNEFIIEQ